MIVGSSVAIGTIIEAESISSCHKVCIKVSPLYQKLKRELTLKQPDLSHQECSLRVSTASGMVSRPSDTDRWKASNQCIEFWP